MSSLNQILCVFQQNLVHFIEKSHIIPLLNSYIVHILTVLISEISLWPLTGQGGTWDATGLSYSSVPAALLSTDALYGA